MINDTNKKLNLYLEGQRLSKEYYHELKTIAEKTNFDTKIMDWFRMLQSNEITGWRGKGVTNKICDILSEDTEIEFYALFCPSYKKGEGAFGFRVDSVGKTTLTGLTMLSEFYSKSLELGFICKEPKAIFFDIALEQPEKTISAISDLSINIDNFKNHIPKNVQFCLLSDLFPELMDIVGYTGIKVEPSLVPDDVFARIVERGAKFYQLFGWNQEQILERSRVIASSEAIVGAFLRNRFPKSIMLYIPTMLERARVYSGNKQDDPLPIIFPKHEGS